MFIVSAINASLPDRVDLVQDIDVANTGDSRRCDKNAKGGSNALGSAHTKGRRYTYLRDLDSESEDMESSRLVYVAATRAEHRLHLLGFVKCE